MTMGVEKALRIALKMESDGAQYYEMAAKECKHKGIKEIFKKYAEDEKEHYETILHYYDRYTETGVWPENALEKSLNHSAHELEKLFTREFFEGLKTSSSELSAISTGILLEDESIKFYKEMAEKEQDYLAKKFYEELIKIEIEHHTLLVKAEKELMDKIWAHNRYAPM